MPTYQVSRSIIIDKPIQQVRDSLIDYQQWPIWSPWLIMEPETKLTYSDEQSIAGANYSWSGDITGKGEMTIKSLTDTKIEMVLQFISPFKSVAQVSFDLEEQANSDNANTNSTKATWNMNGSLPFFLFWMVSKMKVFIGMDYERGLNMLKEYLETGIVASKIKVDGILTTKSQQYIGISRTNSIKEMQETMSVDFENIFALTQSEGLTITGAPFAIYNLFDVEKGKTSYISAIPVEGDYKLPSDYISGELKAMEGLQVTHTGSYQNNGNAWSTAMSFARVKKIKTTKSPVGIEFYVNNPVDTAPEDLITEVFLPLK